MRRLNSDCTIGKKQEKEIWYQLFLQLEARLSMVTQINRAPKALISCFYILNYFSYIWGKDKCLSLKTSLSMSRRNAFLQISLIKCPIQLVKLNDCQSLQHIFNQVCSKWKMNIKIR